jgi:hypothetical protein
MKAFALPMLAVTALLAVLAGSGLLAVMNLDHILAHYPGAEDLGAGHFNWRSAFLGHISHDSSYQTGDNIMTVWHWYAQHLAAQPTRAPVQGDCVALEADQRLLVQRTARVFLCAAPHRTLVFVNQAWSLWP